MMSDTRIEEYAAEDESSVLQVLRLALGETPLLRRTPELWDWKHELNPFGRSLVLVAKAGTRVVGVRALMRWDLMTSGGATVRCARAVDTATHPDYLRRGIFRNLTLAVLDLARSKGIQLIFNTPNAKSKPGYLEMGWTEVGPIGVLVRPSLRLLRIRSHADEGHYVQEQSSRVGIPADRSPFGLRTPRTASYLKWRFESHPTARYSAICVDDTTAFVRSNLRNGRRELIVSDVIGDDPGAAYRAVGRASTADYIVTWHGRGSPERRAAVASGLLPVPGFKALTLVANCIDDVAIETSHIRSWDLSIGDLELL
jgi:GNAT superfamily N-acetyltransferase